MPSKPPQYKPLFQPPRVERRGDAAQRGYGADWQRFRDAFIQANPLCCFADDPRHKHECTLMADVADHIQPLSQGGARLDERNLRPVCRRAHDVITWNLRITGKNELPAADVKVGNVAW